MTTRCSQPLPAECNWLLCSQAGIRLLLSIHGGACRISHPADRTICKTTDAILALNYHAYLRWGCNAVIDW